MIYAYLQRSWQCSQNLTDSQQEALEMAVSEAERMTEILQNLLDIARASHSMMPLQPELLVLNDLVADIVQMTAKDEVSDRVAGLDAGADDYVVKPFSIEELLARIRAHLCRTQETDEDLLQFEDLSLNHRTREVFRGKRSIELTAKEFDLLEYLLSHPRQVFTRDQILEKVWGYDFMGDSNIIEVYIRYLRLKLEENNEKRLIHTVRGVGYALREQS